jgi:hypothetical protein
MLDTAKHRLAAIMSSLDAEIRDGVPIVGLEPSCVSVFRDELVNLFPASEQARRLKSQTCTLAEWLDRHADRLASLRLERRAIAHGHCHHKAIMQMDPDWRVLDRIGVRYDVLDSGCCGMAGAFGFEADHYDVSMAIGERACCLPSAARRATPSSSPTASAAASRSRRPRTGARCILPKSCTWRCARGHAVRQAIFRSARTPSITPARA